MPDLKPCPFCGGKDSGILTTSYDGYWFAVFCENCMAQTRKCRQEKDAVEAWNRRAGERKEGTVMDVRGKLVELLDNAIIDSDDNYGFPNTNQVADHLISNGVTVQGWISIDDMLPEIPEGWTGQKLLSLCCI